jgi:predicted nucleic acid-binding protein
MRFVDSNVFLHAFLIPRRKLTGEEERIKDESKAIVKRIEEDEEVATSTVHLSEIVNIIEAALGLQQSIGFLVWAISKENVDVYPTSKEHYEAAASIAKDRSVSVNDALAYILMKKHGLTEIYSFDKHFNQLQDITKLPAI